MIFIHLIHYNVIRVVNYTNDHTYKYFQMQVIPETNKVFCIWQHNT